MPEPRAFSLDAAGMSLPALEWGRGDGPRVLALHGFLQEAATFGDLAMRLAAGGCRVVAFDQRGYAPGTDSPLSAFTLATFAGDALAVAAALGWSEYHLLGFGMGAMQAWAAAPQAGPALRSLTALRFPHPAAFAMGVHRYPAQRAAWDRLEEQRPPERGAADWLAGEAEAFRAFLRRTGLPEPMIEPRIRRLSDPARLAAAIAWHLVPLVEMEAVPPCPVPALYVYSGGSAATLPETADACAEFVTGAFRRATLNNPTVWTLETEAEALARLILPHLDAAARRQEPSHA